jgi:NtrC-family two-component system sensor histidine kinase KinB
MLRARLFLNLIPFVVILLAVGVYAIVLFSQLTKNVEVTVMENYRSAIAAREMNGALRGMELSLHFAKEGNKLSAAALFEESARLSEASLAILVTNRHLFKGTQLIEQLQTNHAELHKAGESILGLSPSREQQAVFDNEAVPRLLAIKLLLEKTGAINHANILATTENNQEITRHITSLMIAGMAVALLISFFASLHLSQAILRPIQLLTRATREVGQGKLDQIIPVLSHDELGELGHAFNKMAAQLQVYRQSTSEQIMRLHRTMESALASFPDPIFILDRAGRIELENPAAQNLTARLGLPDALPERLWDAAREVLRTTQDFLPHSFNQVISFRVDGAEHSFLPRILTMRGQENEPVGVAVVLNDVTRFRLLDDAKTNLVSTVSHEIKTPLTSVRMVLHLLLEETVGPLTHKQQELLQMARKEAERLLRILNDLLDLARVEAGESALNRVRVAPAELVQGIVDEAQRRVADQGLTLSGSVEPDLPAVMVDRQRISHVFHNFISNALSHSPRGTEIQVRAARADDEGIQFSVIDRGTGIPEDYQAHIFERFFRVPGQARAGAGLGLSIAREIVVAHGGRIGVRSQPGQGSEFYFVLAGAEKHLAA